GVDVDQQRQLRGFDDATRIGEHVLHRRNAEVGHAQRIRRHTAAGEIQRLVAGAPGHQPRVGGDRADDLQWRLGGERGPETCARGMGFAHAASGKAAILTHPQFPNPWRAVHGDAFASVVFGRPTFLANAAKRGSLLYGRMNGSVSSLPTPASRVSQARSSHLNMLPGSLRSPYTSAIWYAEPLAAPAIRFFRAASAAARSSPTCKASASAMSRQLPGGSCRADSSAALLSPR